MATPAGVRYPIPGPVVVGVEEHNVVGAIEPKVVCSSSQVPAPDEPLA